MCDASAVFRTTVLHYSCRNVVGPASVTAMKQDRMSETDCLKVLSCNRDACCAFP